MGFLLFAGLAVVVHARKCRYESHFTTCAPPTACRGGFVVPNLCDDQPDAGFECCVPGTDALCTSAGGSCIKGRDCRGGKVGNPDMCPGTSQIVCCLPKKAKAPSKFQKKLENANLWRTMVQNRITDLTDYLLHNLTNPKDKPGPLPKAGVPLRERLRSKMCWPLAQASSKKLTVTTVSWGASRENGYRCHAGVDMWTSIPGEVVSISYGQVVAIRPGFAICTKGWGLHRSDVPTNTSAVLVYYPLLSKTVNYGEMDPDKIKVKPGQIIRSGQTIGTASLCGMLHFELYNGRQSQYHTWRPTKKVAPLGNHDCLVTNLASKPKTLEDPRPLLQELEGRFCA